MSDKHLVLNENLLDKGVEIYKELSMVRKIEELFILLDLKGENSILGPRMRKHVHETPERIVRAWKEYLVNLCKEPPEMKVFLNDENIDEILLCRNIWFNSLCAHHFFPFSGVAHFAYIPDKYLVGLSKMPRLVKYFAKQPQYQERIATQTVNWFMETVKPRGCMIIMDARHECTACRGVESESRFTHSTVRGCFLDNKHLETKVYQLLGTSG